MFARAASRQSQPAVYVAGMRYALAAAAAVLVAAAAHAEALPPPVQAAVAEARRACEPDRTKVGPGLLKRLDLNGDGVPDFVISYEAVSCAEAGRINCGSAGCLTQVFASTPTGYEKVLDENVQDVSFKRVKGRPAMLLGLHGSSCGKAGFEACGATLYWNGSKFSPAH